MCVSALANDPLLPGRVQDDCGLYAYAARITDVSEGGTVTADVDLGFNTWRKGEKPGLFGIDTPEVRGEERGKGLIARDALRERVFERVSSFAP